MKFNFINFNNIGYSCLTQFTKGSNKVVVLLPGARMAPGNFFCLPVYPNSTTIADQIVNAGYDVVLFDPIGWGRGHGKITTHYSRKTVADQLVKVISFLKNEYQYIYLHGFCTSGHAPLIAAMENSVSGIVVQSPVLIPSMPESIFVSAPLAPEVELPLVQIHIDSLIDIRIKLESDKLIGTSNKLEGWKTLLEDYLLEHENFPRTRGVYLGIEHMDKELGTFVKLYNTQGWDIRKISCPIAIFNGEFDVESSGKFYSGFANAVKPNLVSELTVKGGTHFSPWETAYDEFTNQLINSLDALAQHS